MNDGKKDKKGIKSNPADEEKSPETYEYVDLEIEALRNILYNRKKKPGRFPSEDETKPAGDNPDADSSKK